MHKQTNRDETMSDPLTDQPGRHQAVTRPTQGQTFFYFGPDVDRFIEVFQSREVVLPRAFARRP
jgi:hypothetical protein